MPKETAQQKWERTHKGRRKRRKPPRSKTIRRLRRIRNRWRTRHSKQTTVLLSRVRTYDLKTACPYCGTTTWHWYVHEYRGGRGPGPMVATCSACGKTFRVSTRKSRTRTLFNLPQGRTHPIVKTLVALLGAGVGVLIYAFGVAATTALLLVLGWFFYPHIRKALR
jgi:hypothetical protein